MTKKLNLGYFAGGSEITLLPFHALLESKHEIRIVYTKKLMTSVRGKIRSNNSLIKEALKRNINVKTIDYFSSASDTDTIRNLKLDFIIVFSFGIILPKEILKLPRYGCINIHTSLLPKWRGASPVQHALLNNEKQTGITFIIMNENMDEGDIIYRETVIIEEYDNYKTLLDKITKIAAKKIVRKLEEFVNKNIRVVKQDNSEATYCYRIKKEDTYISFDKEAHIILGQIKAFAPKPGAKCFLRGELVKILEANIERENELNKNYGVVVDNSLLISCKKGFIRLIKVQREGRKAMYADDLLNGWKVKLGLKVNAGK